MIDEKDEIILIVSVAEIDLYSDDELEMKLVKCLKQRLPKIESNEMFFIHDYFNIADGVAFTLTIGEKDG